jgi:hypothetical protein
LNNSVAEQRQIAHALELIKTEPNVRAHHQSLMKIFPPFIHSPADANEVAHMAVALARGDISQGHSQLTSFGQFRHRRLALARMRVQGTQEALRQATRTIDHLTTLTLRDGGHTVTAQEVLEPLVDEIGRHMQEAEEVLEAAEMEEFPISHPRVARKSATCK